MQDIFSAASQKTSRSWPAEMPSTSLKRKRSEGEEASLSTKRQKAAAKTPEISQDFKKTISTKQAFAQVQSEGLSTFVNAWKKSLPKGLSLTDLTHIKKSTGQALQSISMASRFAQPPPLSVPMIPLSSTVKTKAISYFQA
ncbi:hypothetical protein [Epibacterium ulvae]|uniref:hypothetical protein n=1 Tax=Epibacterium ulvae TaxID=1156985 RepID=UPI0024935D4E|nr:hypothetical protein [Epibacterium ulvae]